MTGQALERAAHVEDDHVARLDHRRGETGDPLLFLEVGAVFIGPLVVRSDDRPGLGVLEQDVAVRDGHNIAVHQHLQVPADGHFRHLQFPGQLPDRGGAPLLQKLCHPVDPQQFFVQSKQSLPVMILPNHNKLCWKIQAYVNILSIQRLFSPTKITK